MTDQALRSLQELALRNIATSSEAEVLEWMAELIDISFYLGVDVGACRVLELAPKLRERPFSKEERAILEYFLGNAEADRAALNRTPGDFWEDEHHEGQIRQFRRALLHAQEAEALEPLWWQRICTNLGNALSGVGRVVEAMEMHERALERAPFAMALGNKGIALASYAGLLYDDGHQDILLARAHELLTQALERESELDTGAGSAFLEWQERLAPYACDLSTQLREFPLGDSEAERDYRRWCLEHRLFLNPLNDALTHSVAATDVFHLPDMTTRVEEDTYFYGLYNQLKQEYVSARFALYEAQQERRPHFSDRDVLLYNTLDFPRYGWQVEQAKTAVRGAYSVLGRIALFLRLYFLEEAATDGDVYLANVWFERNPKGRVSRDPLGRKTLRTPFRQGENWPLRGLFWLSKDFRRGEELRDALEPEARLMDELRHHAEHLYLKVVEYEPIGADQFRLDRLATIEVSERRLHEVGLRLMRTVRAALLYLSLAVHVEERRRAEGREPDRTPFPMPLHLYDDERKR